MTERPIILSGPRVRAAFDGTKTQTRRIMNPQPAPLCRYEMNAAGNAALHLGPPMSPNAGFSFVPPTPRSKDHRLPCPYGAPGDRLWVRETWRPSAGSSGEIFYAADVSAYDYKEKGPWRPPIFMPRSVSRLTLEITELRVQRLHDITEADAHAEGVEAMDGYIDAADLARAAKAANCSYEDARAWFACLWDEINGERGPWESNPWVWAVTFKKLEDK